MRNTIDKNKLIDICKKYGIDSLGIFGSYARGDFTSKSDLDFLVKFLSRRSLLEMVRIEREISELLGVRVDLLTENAISPYLRDKITKGLRLVYDRKR